jgi:hypothetical protein
MEADPEMSPGGRPGSGPNRGPMLSRLVPADGGSFRYAARGIVLLVLVHLCWLQLRPESEWRRIRAATTASAAGRTATTEYERIASQSGNDNVLLKLAGYARTNRFVEDSLAYFYYRTSYALYPRRLFAAPPDIVINSGRDIMQTGFNPDPQWLQEHHVRSVLIFGNDTPGGETPRLVILPPRDGQAVMQTNQAGGNP